MMAQRREDEEPQPHSAWLQEAKRCYWHAARGKRKGASAPYEQLSWWYLMRHYGMVQGTAL
jgi:hypothetical protein